VKITIDLAEAFDRDPETGEMDYKGVREAIIEKAAYMIVSGDRTDIDRVVSEKVGEAMTSSVKAQMQKLFVDFLDEEFVPVNEYGSRSAPTSVRNQIASIVKAACTMNNDRYGNANTFAQVVRDAVDARMKEFKAEFSKQVDNVFVATAIAHATAELKRKLGVTS
jgi:hypothetical protein